MGFRNVGNKTAGGEFDVGNNYPLPVAVGMPKILKVTSVASASATANNAVVLATASMQTDTVRCIVMNIHASVPAYLNNTAPADTTDGLRLAAGESWHFRPDAPPYSIGTAAVSLKVIELG